MPKQNPESFFKRNRQVIIGLVSAVVLLAGGLVIQHRTDNPSVSDKPVARAPGSATYQGDITEVELRGLYAGSVSLRPSQSNTKADVQTTGTETGDLKLITTVRGNKLTVRQTGDCVTPGGTSTCAAAFQVSVPASASITGDSKGAAISLTNLKGEVNVHNAGPLTATGLSGRLRLETDTGLVTLESTTSKQVDVVAHNGNVNVQFAIVPTTVSAVSDRGDVDVRLPSDGTYKVAAETPTGTKNVTVKQDAGSASQITARTSQGSVTVRN